jgi:hypothetical protein
VRPAGVLLGADVARHAALHLPAGAVGSAPEGGGALPVAPEGAEEPREREEEREEERLGPEHQRAARRSRSVRAR